MIIWELELGMSQIFPWMRVSVTNERKAFKIVLTEIHYLKPDVELGIGFGQNVGFR